MGHWNAIIQHWWQFIFCVSSPYRFSSLRNGIVPWESKGLWDGKEPKQEFYSEHLMRKTLTARKPSIAMPHEHQSQVAILINFKYFHFILNRVTSIILTFFKIKKKLFFAEKRSKRFSLCFQIREKKLPKTGWKKHELKIFRKTNSRTSHCTDQKWAIVCKDS